MSAEKFDVVFIGGGSAGIGRPGSTRRPIGRDDRVARPRRHLSQSWLHPQRRCWSPPGKPFTTLNALRSTGLQSASRNCTGPP